MNGASAAECQHTWVDYAPGPTMWGESQAYAALHCTSCGIYILPSREGGSWVIESSVGEEVVHRLREALEAALHLEHKQAVAEEHIGTGYARSKWMGQRLAAADVNRFWKPA